MKKILILIASILILSIILISSIDVGPNNPGTMADDATVGTQSWSNVDNAKVSDDTYAGAILLFEGFDVIENSIKLVKDGAISGNDKSTGAAVSVTESYISYGGASDLWGLSWDAADINANDFGVVGSWRDVAVISHYLNATNFGFNIPAGATINGILVEIEQKKVVGTGSSINVDHMRITVYYTEAEGEFCYQESANVSNQTGIDGDCGLNYSGSYESNGVYPGGLNPGWVDEENIYDGNWGTWGRAGYRPGELNITYSIPSNALNSSLWRVKGGSLDNNLTIPNQCWGYGNNVIKLYLESDLVDDLVDFYCYNSSESLILINASTVFTGVIYEEAMWWDISEAVVESPKTSLRSGKLTFRGGHLTIRG